MESSSTYHSERRGKKLCEPTHVKSLSHLYDTGTEDLVEKLGKVERDRYDYPGLGKVG